MSSGISASSAIAISVEVSKEGTRKIGSIGVSGGSGGGGGRRRKRSTPRSNNRRRRTRMRRSNSCRVAGYGGSGEVWTSPPTPPTEIKVHATRAEFWRRSKFLG